MYVYVRQATIHRTTVYFNCFSSSDGCHSRLLEFRHQTSDAVLELAVLGGVDERVDTVVGQHQYHGEVVEPVCKVRTWTFDRSSLCINEVYIITEDKNS